MATSEIKAPRIKCTKATVTTNASGDFTFGSLYSGELISVVADNTSTYAVMYYSKGWARTNSPSTTLAINIWSYV